MARRAAWLVLGLIILGVAGGRPAWAAADEWERSFNGPLLVRNDQPLYLTLFSTALPDRARTVAPHHWAWAVGYHGANTIADQNNLAVTDRIIVDAEVQRLEASLKYGWAERWELGVTAPYLIMGGGYMDAFIRTFEDSFGFTTPRARKIRGRNEFRYLFKVNGRDLIDETDKTIAGLGDIPVQVKYQFRDKASGWLPRLAVRGMLKFPTASHRLLGNDRVDGGVGLLAEQPIGDRWMVLANLDLTTTHLPTALKTVDIDPVMVTGTLSAEYFLTNRASVQTQFTAASNPYPTFDKDMTALNSLPMGIALGWTYRWRPRARLTLTAVENINSAWPDFVWSAAVSGDF